MKISKVLSIFFMMLFSTLLFSESLPLSDKIVSGKLDNGLEYYIYQNKKPEGKAYLNLIIKAGSLQEKDSQQGLAHFLEHMAFNGTTKYKKNDIIKYLQSIGLTFGGDLNAYTSFEETVYELNTPSDKKDLETAIEVLKEWSSEMTLNPNDIEEEKNVILEEWRLRQGLSQRMGDIQKKVIFGDSFYSKRFPIGKPENIQNANKNLLENYYKTWYQPHNMAIVAVGDFSPENVETYIKKYFSSLKNTTLEKRKEHLIPLYNKNEIITFTDPELTTTKLTLFIKNKIQPVNSTNSLKTTLEKNIFTSILNSRFSQTSKTTTSPYISSYSFNSSLNSTTGVFGVGATIKDNNINGTLENIFINLKEISSNGVSSNILELEKINLINQMKLIINNKDSIENAFYSSALKEYFLNDVTFMDPSKEFEISKNIISAITSEDMQKIATNLLQTPYNIFITSNSKNENKIPSKNNILSLIEATKNKTIEKNNFNSLNLMLNPLNIKEGEITFIKNFPNYSEYKLSNGIKVLYKETNFDKDSITITLSKPIGSSNFNYKDYINSIFLPNIIKNSGVSNISSKDIEMYFKGKNFSVYPYIDTYSQGFIIKTTHADLKESLNYFRSLVEYPIISSEVFSSEVESFKESIKNRENSPMAVFIDNYLKTLNLNHPRKKSLTLEDLNELDSEIILKIYKESLTNFYGYSMEVVGSITKNDFLEISKKYFASLPTNKNDLIIKPLGISYPKNIVKKEVVKGIDKKSTVIITYPFKMNYSLENRAKFKALANITNSILLDEIREKLGGVYSINTSGNLDYNNYGENNFQIYFNTDTKRVEEISSAVISVVNNIISGNFKEDKVLDVQESYKLAYQDSIKENSFWSQVLKKKNLITDYEFYTPIRYNSIVNYNSIKDFAKQAIDKNNYVEVVLLPEREE